MTMTAIRLPGHHPTLAGQPPQDGRQGISGFSRWCAGSLVLAILVLIAFFTTNQALAGVHPSGLDFFTSKEWDPTRGKFGALAFIFGTVITSLIALVFAVPVSLGHRPVPDRVGPAPAAGARDLPDRPAGRDSLGRLRALGRPVPALSRSARLYKHISSGLNGVPVLGRRVPRQDGRSFFTAGLIVALMIMPIITSLTREVFATVPRTQKEAALALGATRWEMMRTSILGYGRAGVVGAVMLGLGRAMGETIAVALVIGSFPRITPNLFQAGDAMAAVIANQFGEASGVFRAALIGLGVTLFAITIIINIIARAFISRSEKGREGEHEHHGGPLARASARASPSPRSPAAAKFATTWPRRRSSSPSPWRPCRWLLLVIYVVRKGLPIFGWGFLTKPIPDLPPRGPGMGPAVVGTIVITVGGGPDRRAPGRARGHLHHRVRRHEQAGLESSGS